MGTCVVRPDTNVKISISDSGCEDGPAEVQLQDKYRETAELRSDLRIRRGAQKYRGDVRHDLRIGETGRRGELPPLRIAAEGAPVLLPRGEGVVHEHVDEARHARADERPREEHRRQADAAEDLDLPHLGK